MSVSAISSPLKALEQTIVGAFSDIEAWFRTDFAKTPPSFYSSTDLRNNGSKIAPVDTNLFPGGFNNLAVDSHPLAAEAIHRQIDALCPEAKSVLLIPENHTRNTAYLDNIATLKHLFEIAGISVCLGRLDNQVLNLTSASGETLAMQAVERSGDKLHCNGVFPCVALLNNDLSDGMPAILQNTQTQVLPALQLGWATRKKSGHFYEYQRVTEQFADLLNVDPWLLAADFSVCPKVDFHKREGMECLATAIAETLDIIRNKYEEHGINDAPYVVIKANVGTYGMGVMSINDPQQVFSLNRKQRNNMATGKGSIQVRDVLIQEGVRTLDTFNNAAAEPVVYMIGGTVVGGFYRVNATRGSGDNLNSRGMSFSPLPFETNCAVPARNDNDSTAARLYVYSVVARLATLAAARERQALAAAS